MSLKLLKASLVVASMLGLFSCNRAAESKNEEEEHDQYEYRESAALFELMRTKDPALGRVPRERLVPALEYSKTQRTSTPTGILSGVWDERGPFSDTYHPSTNGNTRYNNDITSGRIRSLWVDRTDPTGNTVWVGGVAGGLWKGTNVTSPTPTWTLISDFFSNMAVSSVCQNPSNPNIMYFGTGEGFFNADAVQGDGIWRSLDGGVTWAQLPSTVNFDFVTKMLCDASGNLFVTVRSNTSGAGGVLRSMNNGDTWTNITPSGLSQRGSDLEISSTGRLHIITGFGQTSIGGYRYTDNPTTVTSGTWTSATTPFTFPSGTLSTKVDIACLGNTLYCLPSTGTATSSNSNITGTWKSIDGGANWFTVTPITSPLSTFTNGLGWYAMGIEINPANPDNVIAGSIDCWQTTDGGNSWTKISQWVGLSGLPNEYVHADVHDIKFIGGGGLYVASDGGVFYSNDGGATFRDRNTGLRIKQFYSCDIHPSNTHYILGGTQDNGVHKFSVAGLGPTLEVTGGDGSYVHIDQTPGDNFSFGSFTFNRYRRSTNQFTTNVNSINFLNGSAGSSSDFGRFINPTDYDDAQNIMYCAGGQGVFFRWNNPTTCPAGTYYSSSNFGGHAENVTLSALGSGTVSAVTVSPHTPNRVFFGTGVGTICYADGANTGTSITGTSLGSFGNYVNCIAVGSSDDHLLAVFTNYGVNQVLYTSNATSPTPTWTAIDGNLPDMPVRWAMFAPGNNTKAIIATEAGVFTTSLINGASTSWVVSPTFPLVRTDMLAYRPSDGLVVAATHGRGMWTQNISTVIPVYDFLLNGTLLSGDAVKVAWSCNWASSVSQFEVEVSTDGRNFTKVATVSGRDNTTSYQYTYRSPNPFSRLFFRIRNNERTGISKYSNTMRIASSGSIRSFELSTIMPNPVRSDFLARFNTVEKGEASLEIYDGVGRMVSNRKVPVPNAGAYSIPYNISNLQNGTYVLVMRMNGYKAEQRLIKQ